METKKKYVFTDDMDEISGFGGSYERVCREMIVAGLEYLDDHPKLDPKFHGYKDVFGIISEDNQDAKDLSNAMTKVSDDITGAMHQACVQHVLYIRKNGWEKYAKLKREAKLKNKDEKSS